MAKRKKPAPRRAADHGDSQPVPQTLAWQGPDPTGRAVHEERRRRSVAAIAAGDGNAAGTGASISAGTGAPVTRLSLDGYGARRAGSFADKRTTREPAARGRQRKSSRSSSLVPVIKSRTQVLFYSRILINALEEAVDYVPSHTNRPPPELRLALGLEEQHALRDIRELIAELKKLNAFVEKRQALRSVQAKRTVIDVRAHLNTFLNAAAIAAGTGVGGLAVAVGYGLLDAIGLPVKFPLRLAP